MTSIMVKYKLLQTSLSSFCNH